MTRAGPAPSAGERVSLWEQSILGYDSPHEARRCERGPGLAVAGEGSPKLRVPA